jgi:hypothetical protein
MNLFRQAARSLRTTRSIRRYATGGFENILAGGPAPAVQVRSLGPGGIQLVDGLEIPSACIFLEGKVFLWDVPQTLWKDWTNDHFQIFDVVVPKPGLYWESVARLYSTNHNTRDSPARNWKKRSSTTSYAS